MRCQRLDSDLKPQSAVMRRSLLGFIRAVSMLWLEPGERLAVGERSEEFEFLPICLTVLLITTWNKVCSMLKEKMLAVLHF